MSMTRQTIKNDCYIFATINDLVPENHLVRKLEEAIDLRFIEDEVKDLYAVGGRPSIPPVVLFKLLIINYTFGINSMRRTCEECKVNLAYRWYLGLSINDDIPNYSTWSQNYIRRYHGTDIFEKIFKRILKQISDANLLDVSTIYMDGTHQKANANKNKYVDKEVEIKTKEYEKDLLSEINAERGKLGKKPIDKMSNQELDFDEETGEEIIVTKTKHIKESKTDPESGNYHKGEHEKCFAFTHQAICENHGFVIGHSTTPGNFHDSAAFYKPYEEVIEEFKKAIKNACLDSGYNIPAICKRIIEDGITPLMPYSRPKGHQSELKRKEFLYNKENDTYTCPNGEILKLSTIDKSGYKIYKSDKCKCENCPLLSKCTQSKNHQKIIARHIWQDYKDIVNNNRHTDLFKKTYPNRKQNIERVFAICKEEHGLRFTRLKGLKKNSDQASLIFACYNLKKYALYNSKNIGNSAYNINYLSNFHNFLNFAVNFIKKIFQKENKAVICTTLSTI